jgi:hypothetical protein
MGRGPRLIVLPRGTRLRVLPGVLRGCSHVLVRPWVGETQLVAIGSLLSVAGEILLRTPLLLQEHMVAPPTAIVMPVLYDRDAPPAVVGASDPNPLAQAPADVTDSVSDGNAHGATPAAATAKGGGGDDGGGDDGARAEALAVQNALGLSHTIGVVTLGQLPATRRPAAVAPDHHLSLTDPRSGGSGLRWMPTGVSFGLPLSEGSSCEAACAAIQRRKLFGEESLAAHAQSLDALLERLQRVVASYSHAVEGANAEEPVGGEAGLLAGDEDGRGAEQSADCDGDGEGEAAAGEEAEAAAAAEDAAYPLLPLVFDGSKVSKLSCVI